MKKIEKKSIFPLKPEYVFLIAGFVFGLIFVYTNPPFQSNDEDRHFYYAFALSEGNLLPEQQGEEKYGIKFPANLIQIGQSFQGIPFSQDYKISKSKIREMKRVKLDPENKIVYDIPNKMNRNPLQFFPHSLGILIGRGLDSNPIALNYAARIGGLIAYLALMFFTIRITPIFKTVFMLAALTPMALFQGASVTYDTMNLGLSFLMIAAFLRYALDESIEKLTLRDYLLLAALALAHRFAKDGYIFLPLLFFIIPYRKIGAIWKIVAVLAAIAILYYIPDWTWKPIVRSHMATLQGKGQAFQKDFGKGSSMSVFLNPFFAFDIIYSNTRHFIQEWIGGMMGRFGYSYAMFPNFIYVIHGLIILTFAFLCGKAEYELATWRKIFILVVGVMSIVAIIAGFYLISPAGARMIFGLQGRYLIPFLPLLLLPFYNSQFDEPKWRLWRPYVAAIYSALILAYSASFMNSYFYNPL